MDSITLNLSTLPRIKSTEIEGDDLDEGFLDELDEYLDEDFLGN